MTFTIFARWRSWAALAALAALLTLAGCGSSSTTTGSSTCDQACQDNNMLYAVKNSTSYLYNTYVAYTSSTVNVSPGCPLGGTATITGTASGSGSNTTVSLTYLFNSCGIASSNAYSLTWNGTLTWTGTFNSPTTFESSQFASTSLSYNGTVSNLNTAVSGYQCPISVAYTFNSPNYNYSGSVCGRTAGYSH